MSDSRNNILITLGDPAGVGPEIICKAVASLPNAQREKLAIVGSLSVLRQAAEMTGCDLRFGDGGVTVHDVPIDGDLPEIGRISGVAGDAAYRYIERAVRLAEAGQGCIVTAPINKEALNLAGHHFDGHTGLLAHLTNAPSSFMLLASERLSSIHVSTHVSLSGAIGRVRPERILATIRAGHDHFKRIGVAKPRIAVAGLNPHCGEHGLFGDEDETYIAPAAAAARAEGIEAFGPISGDTVFYRAWKGEFDLVVAQYHDQGHIPVKLIAFDTTVNISLGLPIDRTSVDHGTAFDIAGKGVASYENLLAAMASGWKLAGSPRRAREAA